MKHIFTLSITLCFYVAAFSQAGTLDNSFSGDGKAIIGFAYGGVAGEDDCRDLAIQSDGKSVLVGCSNATQGGDYNFVVARLNTDGTLDQSFNGKGYVFINFSGDDRATSVAIQSDGKIVIAGTANYNGVAQIAVARLLTNGFLDPSFGGNFSGKVVTGFSYDAFAHSLAIQGDGKIVVGGSYDYNVNDECLLLRYNTNGTLDQSFGVLGRSFTDFGSNQTATSVAIQTDGKIVVGADGNISGPPLIARFRSNGSLDAGFGNNGKKIISLLTCAAIAIQGNGKILVTGSYQGSQYSDFALARYNINGTIDTTFSGDGKVITNISTYASDDWSYDIAIQGDGKIVVAGHTFRSVATGNENFGLVRYNNNGTLDNTFGDHGKVITDFGNSTNGNYERAYAVKIQPNGKIVAAGTRNENFPGNFAIARYHGDNATPEIFASDANNENTTAEKFSSIHIYPNPARTTLRVEGLDASSPVTISITDLRGIIFQSATVTDSEYKFDVSALKPGIYSVTISFGNGEEKTLKFVKQ